MKRLVLCLVILVMLTTALLPATAETLGWGFVNSTDVALRRGVGGERITRLPKDTCVWINDCRTDSSGTLWYEIKTGLHIDHTNYDFSGWMKAEFIDAGATVWHHITQIAASNNGLIVLRSDGTTETAGRPIVAMDGSGWVSPKGWASSYGKAIHVGIPYVGNQYHMITEKDEFISSVNGLRVADGLSHAAALEADEGMLPQDTLPVWKDHAELAAFRYGLITMPDGALTGLAYIGVKKDGSVIAEPAYVTELLVNWSDIADVRIGGSFLLGLKNDGTALISSFGNGTVPDVSSWHDVIAMEAGFDWCVGLKKDGTLVFAGDHTFMNEGHSRE